jgi:hypothetical protein
MIISKSSVMLSLPVELQLQTIHHIRDSITWPSFEDDVGASIQAIKEFYKVLIALSLLHRKWTAVAQSELFRDLYVPEDGKLELLLELLRTSKKYRRYIKHGRSAVLAADQVSFDQLDDFVELADYCPNLAEISCYCMGIELVSFRTSCSNTLESFRILNVPIERFRKLRKLNLCATTIFSYPDTSHPNASGLSITRLSLTGICELHSQLDPVYLPFVRAVTVFLHWGVPLAKISPLLPHLNSLTILHRDSLQLAQCVALSTSLKLLSLSIDAIVHLNSDTQAIIGDRIEVLRVVIDVPPVSAQKLSGIISGSRVMKKVILDGSKSSRDWATVDTWKRTLVPVCKKAKVELWNEDFEADNGKVDLDSE